MCGRFRLGKGREALKEYFGVETDLEWSPRYNLAPTQLIPAVRQHPSEAVRKLSLMRWGLVPYWAPDLSIGCRMINARAETAAEKPAFRDPLRLRRCLIPADGFYEWKTQPRNKQPYCFTLRDESVFAFAGLWDCWKDSGNNTIETCSILTTAPNELLSEVHDRMPVILPRENHDRWLDPGFQNVRDVTAMLTPYPAVLMTGHPVSTRVNAVANDDPQCAVPLDSSGTQQLAFFTGA